MYETTADVLFGKTRQGVLAALFEQPERWFYLRELERLTGLSTGALQHELGRLGRAELVIRERSGNRVNYRANVAHPVFEELRRLVLKTCGIPLLLAQAISTVGAKVDFAAVFGSFAKGTSHARSDIDLLVVGECMLREVLEVVGGVEESTGREIGVRLYGREEFETRKATDPFLDGVLSGPMITVFGKSHDA